VKLPSFSLKLPKNRNTKNTISCKVLCLSLGKSYHFHGSFPCSSPTFLQTVRSSILQRASHLYSVNESGGAVRQPVLSDGVLTEQGVCRQVVILVHQVVQKHPPCRQHAVIGVWGEGGGSQTPAKIPARQGSEFFELCDFFPISVFFLIQFYHCTKGSVLHRSLFLHIIIGHHWTCTWPLVTSFSSQRLDQFLSYPVVSCFEIVGKVRRDHSNHATLLYTAAHLI